MSSLWSERRRNLGSKRGREHSPQCPDQVYDPTSLLLIAYLRLSPVKDSDRHTKLVSRLHPMTKLRTCGATTPLSLLA